MAITNLNKEADKFNSIGSSRVQQSAKTRKAVQAEMKKDGVRQATLDYIFGGNPDAVSPLQEVK